MSNLNKKQKMIIGVGALAIVIVIIITAIVACSTSKNDSSNEETTTTVADSQNESSQEKSSNKKDDSDDEETKKDEETSEEDSESTDEGESVDESESTEETDSGVSENDNTSTEETVGNVDNEEETTKVNGGQNSSGDNTTTEEEVVFLTSKIIGSYVTPARVTVHDPSIEYDHTTGEWYIFGSHKAFAKTEDMIKWYEVQGMYGSSTFHTVFAESAKWSAKGGTQGQSQYKVDGNLWAPDVIYNKDMKKWCMYMSVNGDNHYSSIAMATADKITGPYTYQGTVVYSGFKTVAELKETDYEKATGSTELPSYADEWGYTGTNAIDPCVLYDKDGQLWMIYGSWFGGTYMLKLDNKTGLRDYTYKIELDEDASDGTAADPYLGIRISGGYGGTGEGPYIVWDEEAGYYYLYLSYCGLNATDGFSGYQMRMFRSKNISGPYTDAAGKYANRKNSSDDQSVKGIKIMGNYYFSSLSTNTANAKNGYMSPGHNSAIIDNEGNRYVVYHTRFNLGNEWHSVRVHQQFVNEDGWLVTAPYEYLGSEICETGYSVTDIVGTYELINHGNHITNNAHTGMLDTKEVKLNKDGSITGDYSGTWSQKKGTYYATLKLDGQTYKGVFYLQYDESTSKTPTMTFSVIGSNNIAIWGSKKMYVEKDETGDMVASYTFDNASSLGKDSVGKVGNATVSGCTSYTDSTRGKVLSFDGTNDYVKLPAAATKNMKGYTIMMWIKPTADNMWTRVFDLGDSTSKYMFVTLKSSSNGIRFAQTVNGNTVDNEQMIDGVAISTNKWMHIALTVNATTKKATLYIDGKAIGTTLMTAYPNGYSGSQNYLGKSQYEDPYFKGYMDNVFIFNYALSESEVTTYMNKK